MKIDGFPMEILLSTAGVRLIKEGNLWVYSHGKKESKAFVVLLNSDFIIADALYVGGEGGEGGVE